MKVSAADVAEYLLYIQVLWTGRAEGYLPTYFAGDFWTLRYIIYATVARVGRRKLFPGGG